MPYTLQDYHNYSKFLPSFFKKYKTLHGEGIWKHEIRDILYEEDVPDDAVAGVRIWTRDPEVSYLCFINSSGLRMEQHTPTQITACLDMWLADVRSRKEEFEAFMQGIAMDYVPLSIPELDRLARPE